MPCELTPPGTRRRVLVAMSGGVDSSVAALLLSREGYEVIGVTMQIWPSSSSAGAEGGCCSLAAVEDARRVADKIGIPHYVLNFQEVFEKEVITPFAEEYLAGRTPNPCITCNERMKFGHLLLRASALDCHWVATGHYARVGEDRASGRYLLRKGLDPRKDQSYTLYGLNQRQLSRTLFPLGGLTKETTRSIARQFGLPVSERPESQEICFIPEDDYRGFLKQFAPDRVRAGPIRDVSGNTVGRHSGIAFYTVGQRKGLGIASETPLYVIRIDPEQNTVIVGPRECLARRSALATRVNFIAIESLRHVMEVTAKVRYSVREGDARIVPQPGGEEVLTEFLEPQSAISPGQAVVWFDKDIVLGGGIIKASQKPA